VSNPGAATERARVARVRRLAGALTSDPVLGVVARRLALSVPLLFVVSALVFLLTSIAPGNATEVILGPQETSGLPRADYDRLAHQLGLDRPLHLQYWEWLSHAVAGDFGISLATRQPVIEIIFQRLSVTLSLVVGTLVVSVLVGVGLGIVSGVRGRAVGRTVDALAMVGWVVPVFWLSAQLIVIFAVELGWFPATGYVPFAQSPSEWARSLVLPVAALSLGAIAGFAKFTREAMLDALASDYIRMARANGESARSIVFQHAFKSALVQVITLTGLLTIGLLVGTVFVEDVFSLPGLGSLVVNAIRGEDLPVVQGAAVFFALIVIAVNLVTDLAYSLVSPKARVE
jgi:peptide/nickel transport system permease protein